MCNLTADHISGEAQMAKSWLEWIASKEDGGWDRREHPGPDLPPLEPADFDPVLGTLNWVKFTEVLHATRSQSAGALLVVDLDDRSTAIELIAEESGADVLPLLAQAIRQAVRADDLVTHLHGYRFGVMLRGAAQEVALSVADRIKESVDDTLFMTVAGIMKLGVAIGGVVFDSSGSQESDLVEEAAENMGAARKVETQVNIQ